MKLTNKLGLPQPIVSAVQNDPYTSGGADYSVTTLIKPPRAVALERRHADEITEDAADRIWSIMGQSIHTILERADNTGIVERRLFIEALGKTVSGQMDRYDNGVLQDYKTTSAWKLIFGDLKEWTEQLNLYAVLLRHNGHEVRGLEAVALLRDWSKRKALEDPKYPQAQVVRVKLDVWPPEFALNFLYERIKLHEDAKKNLPECTPMERWADDDTFAVTKSGRKRAIRVFQTETEAKNYIGSDANLIIEKREGEQFRRCEYCLASQFCEQYQTSQTKGSKNVI